ncbi:scoloptoxin SSD14 isoform X1 [Drosophila biarmipes]|uniref:scoloptoxin SSD14 isoform X1 n=1 Tax=Drosophila biarmipes TaxID=125945 RepID=UPI0021CC5952|nr:scoloptoxin SSD14 isoform X1 [Drosophila biarmipes]
MFYGALFDAFGDLLVGLCKKYAVCWIVLAVTAVGVTLGLVFGLRDKAEEPRRMGAVASNGEGCAEVGGAMLDIGGSAADAAIATMLCEGVMLPHSLGVGGGFVATIYSREMGHKETLVARETAPAAATEDMFVGREITGALASAIPSEIYGYSKLHAKYGRLPWKTLFQPTIDLCRHGIVVSKYLARVLLRDEERIRKEPSMAEIFINPKTDELYKTGEIMYRHTLAETLEIVANEGPEVIYGGGRVGRKLVEDIQAMGGIITEQDLQKYDVRWEIPLHARFGPYELITSPLPTSGAVLTFILNVMEPLYTTNTDKYWQRLIETFKHAYGHRTNLGDVHFEPEVQEIYENLIDPTFAADIRKLIQDNRTFDDMSYYGANFANEEDHGTAHISVLAPNGDAISVTSTINRHFGAKVRSRQTGFILNDQMDDFSTPGTVNAYGIPASPANFIKPGKRPMSSTCPSIFLDNQGDVKLIVGGAGGSRITTSVAQTILRYFVLNEPIEKAVNTGRLHHQLAPNHVDVEKEVPRHTVAYLRGIGHDIKYLEEDKAYTAQTAVGVRGSEPHPVCDRRRVGSAVIVEPDRLD